MDAVVANNELGAVCSKFSGFQTYEEFTSLVETTLKKMQSEKLKKVLCDISSLKVLKPENQEYIQTQFFPKAIALGLSHMAFLTPASAIAQMSANAANEGVTGVVLKYFDDRKSAENWLRDA